MVGVLKETGTAYPREHKGSPPDLWWGPCCSFY